MPLQTADAKAQQIADVLRWFAELMRAKKVKNSKNKQPCS